MVSIIAGTCANFIYIFFRLLLLLWWWFLCSKKEWINDNRFFWRRCWLVSGNPLAQGDIRSSSPTFGKSIFFFLHFFPFFVLLNVYLFRRPWLCLSNWFLLLWVNVSIRVRWMALGCLTVMAWSFGLLRWLTWWEFLSFPVSDMTKSCLTLLCQSTTIFSISLFLKWEWFFFFFFSLFLCKVELVHFHLRASRI